MAVFEERTFDLDLHTLRGRFYRGRSSTARPLIALHGWLDNCASFSKLAPLLANANCDVLALDLSGHGQSDHRHYQGAYNIWQDIPEIAQIANQLQWDTFGLVGHSRGAMISTLFAAIYPERINFLGLIDGMLPLPLEESETLEQLKNAVLGTLTIRERNKTHYPSFEYAVKARERGFTPLCHEDATALAERGVVKNSEGYIWANDPKLMIPSEVKFSKRQLDSFMAALSLTVPLIVGDEGLVNDFSTQLDYIKKHAPVRVHHLPGGHHLHMSEQAQAVADILIHALPPEAI